MPQRPQGLTKRRIKTKRGTTVVYYWRRKVDGMDQRIALGSEYGLARARFEELRKNPPAAVPDVKPLPEPPLTLEAFSRRWLSEYAASMRTPRGRAQAEQRFRDYLWPTLGSMPLSHIKAADIRRLNAELDAKGIGLVTRRRLLEDLRCCLRYASQEAGVLERSPWISGKGGLLPKLAESAPEPLTEMELAEVVRVVPEQWRPVILTLAYTGLRWGELRSLQWKDVRESPYPHLVVSRSHDGPTKSRRVREVPLLPEAVEVLDSLTRGTGAVFSLPETASWIRRFVIQNSWVKDFHIHRLRHTFACRWLERGGTIETLQGALGHSTIKLTERYGRLRPWAVAAEARRIADGGTVSGTVRDLQPLEARK